MGSVHYTTTGRFNLCGTEKEQQVVLRTEFGTVSELWPEGEAPYDGDMTPSEVAAVLRERIGRYLYRGNSAKDLAILDQVDANSARINSEWLTAKAEILESQAASYRSRVAALAEGGAS